MWLTVISVITLAIVAFIVIAYGYRWWRIAHHNEPSVAGGSMGVVPLYSAGSSLQT